MQDDILIKLSNLRKSLRQLLQPKVLTELTNFLEATGGTDDNPSLVEKYHWFCENSENGPNCRYAAMAKNIFIADEASNTAKAINWLYHNWSHIYEGEDDN